MALLTQAQIEKIEFEINSSLQIGDKIYWNPISQSMGGFINYQKTTLLGEVTEIYKNQEKVFYLDGQTPPSDTEIDAELKRLQDEYDAQTYAKIVKQTIQTWVLS